MHWRGEIPVYLGLMKNYNLSIVIFLKTRQMSDKIEP